MQMNLHNVAAALGGEVNAGQVRFPGIGHSEGDRSAAVKFDPAAPDGFVCFSFAGDDPLELKDHVRERLGMGKFQPHAPRERRASKPKPEWVAMIPIPADASPPPAQAANETRHAYYDAEGWLAFYQCRFEKPEGKSFSALSYGHNGDGALRWAKKSPVAPRPLYNLHLLAQYPQAVVILCEGEKAADAAAQLFPLPDYVCITSSNGSQSPGKSDWQPLIGRRGICWPDNDAAGAHYAQAVAGLLPECDYSILDVVAAFGDKPPGWDAADALVEGYKAQQAQELLEQYAHAREAGKESFPKKERPQLPYRLLVGKKGFADGVYYFGRDKEGNPLPPLRICTPLAITARTRDDRGHDWGYLLEWQDPDGRKHEWAMPQEMLAGQGDDYRRELLSRGFDIAPGNPARNHLTHYIQTERTEARALCTDKIGWRDGVFVMPDRSIGEAGQRVIYQSTALAKHAFKTKGTLEGWRQQVAALCRGNHRAVFAISCAFAPILLEMAGEESGGFHFRGDSSSGKTTLLRLAASVWGDSGFLQRWRATTNGLEGLAQLHNDCLLILDELAQVDPKEAGQIAYMLGNGQGRTRANRDGLAKKSASWRLLYLSAGEIGLADHVRDSGQRVKAGQEIRLADIPADAGKGLGVFDKLHGTDNPALFARQLAEAVTATHGTAGMAFIEAVITDRAALQEKLASYRQHFLKECLPENAAGQVERVASRFALVAIAGELATHYRITGWADGEAFTAAKTCFEAWLEARGGAGNLEAQKLLADIRACLEAHEESRFSYLGRDDTRSIHNRMGYIRDGNNGREFILLPEAFKRELCRGHDSTKAAKVMLEYGILIPGADGKAQKRESLPGNKRGRFYVISANQLWAEDSSHAV